MAAQDEMEDGMPVSSTRALRPRRRSRADREVEALCNGKQPKCQENAIKVRSLSGICNNLKNDKRWGARDSEYIRLLPHAYADHKGEPRGGRFTTQRVASASSTPSTCSTEEPDRPLPSARLISTQYMRDKTRLDSRMSNVLMQVGQFLAHDIALTPRSRVRRQCCQRSGLTDDNCFALSIPKGDKTFVKGQCEHFVRSQRFCRKTPRQQMNGMTAFVDGSHIYGAHDSMASLLREKRQGLMKVSSEGFELVPKVGVGDGRFRIVPTLLVLHTLFLREHNRVARELGELRADWDDEQVYQNARRIVIGEWQSVVFGSYLPKILGTSLVNKHHLSIDKVSQYNPNVNPGLANGFASAAMRFGHSQVSNAYFVLDPLSGREMSTPFPLSSAFFNSSLYESVGGRGFDRILRGMLEQQSQRVDRFFSDHLTNSLFGFNNDLVATNIQRGRDHGLPSYNAYRRLCGLSEVCSWNNRPDNIQQSDWQALRKLYRHPKDIDLYVGGVSELPVDNGLVGSTFACLIGQQFEKLKRGDRFFFTHQGQFEERERRALRQRSLSAIICDNAEVKSVREDVFDLSTKHVCCTHNTLKLDLSIFVN